MDYSFTQQSPYDRSKGKGTIHMVNAFATANGMSIGQLKVDSKSNEITAIPKLLDLLDVKGCLITIDAMGCQKKIAQKIRDKEADYLLAVKGNQGMLEQAFNDYFRMDMLQDFDGSIGHLILHFVRTIRVLERTLEQRLLQGSGRYA